MVSSLTVSSCSVTAVTSLAASSVTVLIASPAVSAALAVSLALAISSLALAVSSLRRTCSGRTLSRRTRCSCSRWLRIRALILSRLRLLLRLNRLYALCCRILGLSLCLCRLRRRLSGSRSCCLCCRSRTHCSCSRCRTGGCPSCCRARCPCSCRRPCSSLSRTRLLRAGSLLLLLSPGSFDSRLTVMGIIYRYDFFLFRRSRVGSFLLSCRLFRSGSLCLRLCLFLFRGEGFFHHSLLFL